MNKYSETKIYEDINNYLVRDSRIYFSQINLDGILDFHEYSVMPELYKYLEFEPPKKIEESKLYLEKLLLRIKESDYKSMYWFINLKENHKIIGTLCLLRNTKSINLNVKNSLCNDKTTDFNKLGEVGKGLSPAYWGKGLMSEAMKPYLEFSSKSLNLDMLWSITRVDNLPNIKLMERFGFKKKCIIKNFYKNYKGEIHDGQILEKYF